MINTDTQQPREDTVTRECVLAGYPLKRKRGIINPTSPPPREGNRLVPSVEQWPRTALGGWQLRPARKPSQLQGKVETPDNVHTP